MPTFFRPARVDVHEDGGLGKAIAVLAVAVVAILVVAFIFAHLVLLAAMTFVVGGGTLGLVLLLGRWKGPWVFVRPRPVPRASLRASAAVRELPPPRRELAPVQHVHIHLEGLTPEETARVLAQWRIPPAAIESSEPPEGTNP